MKFLTMGTPVSLMTYNMVRVSVAVRVAEMVVFPAITLANLVMVRMLYKNIQN